MLNTPKMTLMQELIAGSSREELIWLSGYLAGVVAQNSAPAPVAVPSATPAVAAANLPKITVAYGTETGNSKKLATDLAARAKKKGIQAKLVGLEQYRLGDLSKEEYFFAVISTQGDGEPPAAAKKFYDHIHQGGLKLERLKYGVLALGDTSYPLFCKAGEDVDVQLHKMGGQRLLSLRKLDTDYETEANAWIDSVLQQLNGPAVAPAAVTTAAPAPKIGAGKKTWVGTVLANINLNDRGSAKQTHHIEIAAEDVDYQPGDSIGIIPANPVVLVEAIIGLTGADAGKRLLHRTEEHPLQHLLHRKLNIVYLPERVVRKYAGIVKQEIPETKIGLLDLLKIYPVKDIDQFHAVVGILEPIAPRLYSISSSPEAHPGEIHLTVARDNFLVNGDVRFGLCSDGLSQLAVGDSVEFYVHRNTQFRLPAEDSDLIMIGPGTGIAPFRSFLAERDSKGASGKNWLFFGDQHFTTDFLYQTEMQDWVKTGVLTHIHTAFSRDQDHKVYVQHAIRRRGRELHAWIEQGAHVYVCGDAARMARDVHAALRDVIVEQGAKSLDEAEATLSRLAAERRYSRDVY